MAVNQGQIPCSMLFEKNSEMTRCRCCLLYTSDAADERSSVDLGGRRIIKKKKNELYTSHNRACKKEQSRSVSDAS